MMQPDNLLHLIEVLGVVLVGLGSWLWRVAVKCHNYDTELRTLRSRLDDLQAKHSADNARIFARLDEISRDQSAQSAKIEHISETCTQIQSFFMSTFAATVMPGGRRAFDPPSG